VPAQASSSRVWSGVSPIAGSVATSSVGAGRSRAQVQQVRSRLSSIHASGRPPANRSIAFSFQCAPPGRGAPSNHGQFAPRQLEETGQILVGLLFPTGRPHKVESLGQAHELASGAAGENVEDPVDPCRHPRKRAVRFETEQADDAVHVDKQQRSAAFAHGCRGFARVGGFTTAARSCSACRLARR
jgi:hypothetical protein